MSFEEIIEEILTRLDCDIEKFKNIQLREEDFFDGLYRAKEVIEEYAKENS